MPRGAPDLSVATSSVADMSSDAAAGVRPSRWEAQRSFDELGRPLRDVTFCVVDLETTGGSAAAGSMITEIGAVKVRGGEVLGEFQTLVNPHAARSRRSSRCSPASPTRWSPTRPPIESALPAFLEFAPGLRAGGPQRALRRRASSSTSPRSRAGPGRGSRCSTPPSWPAGWSPATTRPTASSPRWPGCSAPRTTPNHRALSDARATVDVLHGLMERLGGLGVHTLEELQTFSSRVTHRPAPQAAPRRALPHAPGVYLFRDDRARVLYVGTSRDLRTRVRTYFTASETRSRMGEMVDLAATRHRDRVRDPARGGGARAAADRRAQAEVQPPLALPREGALRQAHPRAVAAALAGPPGARRRRRLPRPVLVAQGRREVPGRAARDVPGPAVLRPAAQGARPRPPACWPRWAGASPPATAASTPTTTPRWCGSCATRSLRRPDDVVEAINAADDRAGRADERFEEAGVHRDRLGVVPARPRPAPSGCPPSPAAPRSSPRARGRRPVGGPRRPPRPAGRRRRDPARRRRRRVRRRPARQRRDRRSRARARCPRRPPRRPRRCCAGWSPPASGWSTSTASGPARSAAPPGTSRVHDAVNQSRVSLVPFDDRRDLPPGAPAGPVACAP